MIVESKDSLGRIKANEALRLAEQLSEGKYEPFAGYYRALAMQTLGITYRFAAEEKRPFGESYFRAALEEARQIPDQERSLQMQASVLHTCFTGLRFRIHIHRKDDRSISELQREAERLLQAQQAIAEKLNSNALRGRIVLNRAIVLTDSLAQRLLLCMEAVRLYEQSPDVDGLAYTLQYLGFYAEQIGDYPRAIQAFKRSVRLHDSARISPNGLTVCYQSLGDIYAKLSDTTKALENYHRAEPYSDRYDVRFNRIELLLQIGMLYHGRGSLGKAQMYFERAMLISNERIDGYDLLRSAQIYRLQGNFRAALAVLEVSLREMKNLSLQTLSFDILQELALTHQAQAYHCKTTQPSLYRSSLDSALLYAKQCLPILLDERYKVGSAGRFLKTYTLLYELSKEAGDSQSALFYHEEREHWKDKTLSSETYRAIAAMESRAVVEAIESKVETLEAKDRLQRAVAVMIGIATLGLVIIVGLLAWRYNERKRAATVLQAQNDQLTALNIEKNEFLGIAAHDLKNPLSAILSSAEILECHYENDESALDYVRLIIGTSERMLDIIKNLLDINRIESGNMTIHPQPLHLDFVDSIVADYRQRAAQKNIALHYFSASDDDPPVVLADKQALTQVVDNLISNAIKYSPQGKTVFVRVSSSIVARHSSDQNRSHSTDQVTNTLIIANQSTNNYVRIEVQDQGPGISEEDMKKLFGKFVRLSARPTGGEHSTGLGLSIVKKMVEAMNCRVWCESELGNGATFIVELPRA